MLPVNKKSGWRQGTVIDSRIYGKVRQMVNPVQTEKHWNCRAWLFRLKLRITLGEPACKGVHQNAGN